MNMNLSVWAIVWVFGVVSCAWAQTPRIDCPAGQNCQGSNNALPAKQAQPGLNDAKGASAGLVKDGASVSRGAENLGAIKGAGLSPFTRGGPGAGLGEAQQTGPSGPAVDPSGLAGARRQRERDQGMDALGSVTGQLGSNRSADKPGSSVSGLRGAVSAPGMPSRGSLTRDGKPDNPPATPSSDGTVIVPSPDGGSGTAEQTTTPSGDGGKDIRTVWESDDGTGHVVVKHVDRNGRDTTRGEIHVGSDGHYMYMVQSVREADGLWTHIVTESFDSGRSGSWRTIDRQRTVGSSPSGVSPQPTRNVDPDAPGRGGPVVCPPAIKDCGIRFLLSLLDQARRRGGPGVRPDGEARAAGDVPRLRVDPKGAVVNPNPYGETGGTAPSQSARSRDGGALVNPGRDPNQSGKKNP